ncbi:ribonuclease Y [Athalassotoga saccharophila]|uniref:ribonuclease Y n=1 Tax=Athalassotoga saccharophila TaxID=1441386 RepID=UPI001379CFB2|nr:ribonuclease Y [Athalassotoga saccharophila]BBJ27513.1 ribonuclease Y [Athalassotoga saccharophila]
MDNLILIIILVPSVVLAVIIGYYFGKSKILKDQKVAKQDAESIIKNAQDEAQKIKKEMIIEAKQEISIARENFAKDVKKQQDDLKAVEDRLVKREEAIAKREESISKKEEKLEEIRLNLEKEKERISQLVKEEEEKLHEIASLTQEQARQLVMDMAREEMEKSLAKMYSEIKEKYAEEAENEAKWVISTAVQRYASNYVGDITVSSVELPNDDMKGRIIGREGRNIRAFENLTGVDIIIDDTPESVVLSCFDPLRREIAKMTLEKLIEDGRIHPAMIEEFYDKSKKEIEKIIHDEGQKAILTVGISNMHPELIKLLGRLKFRTSFGQNVLYHSIEVAQIAAMMAEEIGLDVEKVKRGALLHDIGKAVDHEVQGTHAMIGGELARRYREKESVVNMIQAHHEEVPFQTPEAVLVAAADSISASRPGARRESIEIYIKRLQKLEEIATSHKNVTKAYAIQAGREIRIIVEPDKIDDQLADKMAYDIAKEIEASLEYPGQIKVVVIREKRSVEYAK